MTRRRSMLVAIAVLAVLATVVAVGVHRGEQPDRGAAGGTTAEAPAAVASRQAEQDPTTLAAAPPRPACDRVTHGFAPRRISVPGATRGAAIVTPPRDVNGIPGTPPLSTYGKTVFAWDTQQGTRPGDRRGNVLLNAHTWPDGSALGNRLLAALHRGGRVVVSGPRGRLCYKVTERVEVPADIQMYRYYAKKGKPQLAILVCSGTRLGPGVWTKRTVWFASPVRPS
jgi:hypothetical protein